MLVTWRLLVCGVCPQNFIVVTELKNARTYYVRALLFVRGEFGCHYLLMLVGSDVCRLVWTHIDGNRGCIYFS